MRKESVNFEEAALLLACTMSQEEIDKEGLQHVVQSRKKKKGSRPGFTCKAVSEGPVGRAKDDYWLPPSRRPSSRQKKRMVGCVLKEVYKMVMGNHFYSFNNKIYHQDGGAAIGNLASEKSGKLLMKRFDRIFFSSAEESKNRAGSVQKIC